MALSTLNRAGQGVTFNVDRYDLDGTALDLHKTLEDAGAVDLDEYHYEVIDGSGNWQLRRGIYHDGTPAYIEEGTLIDSQGTLTGALELRVVVPGVKAEVVTLLGVVDSGSISTLHRAGERGFLSNDETYITLEG